MAPLTFTSKKLTRTNTNKLQQVSHTAKNKAHSVNKDIRIGNNTVQFGKNLAYLTDSTPEFQAKDYNALMKRLDEDGVLLIRGVIPKENAFDAKKIIMDHIGSKGALQKSNDYSKARIASLRSKWADGWTVDAQTGGVVGGKDDDSEGWLDVGMNPKLIQVYDSPQVHSLLENMFCCKSEDVETFPFNTWIRVKGHGDVTIEHADYYYFKNNTTMLKSPDLDSCAPPSLCSLCQKTIQNKEDNIQCTLCLKYFHSDCVNYVEKFYEEDDHCWHCSQCADAPMDFYTCWISLGHVSTENSTLGFVPATLTLSGFNSPPKGRQTPAGFEEFRKSAVWHIPESPVQAGDIFIFNIKTIHAATKNSSREFRLSFDTRLRVKRRSSSSEGNP